MGDKNVLREREKERVKKCCTQKHKRKHPLYNSFFYLYEFPNWCLVTILHIEIHLLIKKRSDESAIAEGLTIHPSAMKNFSVPSAALLNTSSIKEAGNSLFLDSRLLQGSK